MAPPSYVTWITGIAFESVPATLARLQPKLEYQLMLAKKVELIPALQVCVLPKDCVPSLRAGTEAARGFGGVPDTRIHRNYRCDRSHR